MKHERRTSTGWWASPWSLFILFLVAWVILLVNIWQETLYNLGVQASVLVLPLMVLVGGVSFAIWRNWKRAGVMAFWMGIALMVLANIGHEMEQYRPTVTVHIPDGSEGCIHLFPEAVEKDTVQVDVHGIGYMPALAGSRPYKIRVLHGARDITEVMNSADRNEILFHQADSTVLVWTDVSCISVSPGMDYPAAQSDRKYLPCMDKSEFMELVDLGWVDSTRIVWKRYSYLDER